MDESFRKVERHLLLNLPLPDNDISISSYVKNIFNGQYATVLNNEFCKSTIAPLIDENIEENIKKIIDDNKDSHEQWFSAGVASLLYFIQNNWTGPFEKEEIDWLLPQRKSAFTILSLEDQCNENVVRHELLYLAKAILCNISLQETFPTSLWWLFRANRIHQLILEEASAVLFENSENLINKILESNLMDDAALKMLFSVEVTQFYLYYKRIQSTEKYLEDAKTAAKLSLKLVGPCKRTKYQLRAQLYLKAKINKAKELFPYRTCEVLPKVINLSNDLRLEKLELTEGTAKVELGSFEEAVVMAKFLHLQLSQPKDKHADEEITDKGITPYLNCIIDSTKNWALKISALFQRCILEAKHYRTAKRSLSQAEYLIEQLNSSQTPVANRMDLFFASGMKPIWSFKQNLANLMLKMSMKDEALDLYLKHFLLEDYVIYYNRSIFVIKPTAVEIIKQELSKNPTIKLWCLLGDATYEVEHYETAWKLSGEKSSRVQRHWGLYYYSKQKYSEAIPHLKLSVELNNMQENIWVKLGFAALRTEDWKLAVSAYRKCCELEQSNFEVWNNLAKAYIKLGDKQKAWHSLQDAVKCKFDEWEVWDNLMVVSTDLGHFSESIRCCHRILDIGVYPKFEIQSILSKAIINNLIDSEGNSARKYLQKMLKLLARVTAKHKIVSDSWVLYAELTLLKNNDIDNEKAAQYFQQAYQATFYHSRWFQTVKGVNDVLSECIQLAEVTTKCLENCAVTQKITVLSSVKLPLQSVVKKVKDLTWTDQSGIEENLSKLEELLKIILDEIEKLKSMEN